MNGSAVVVTRAAVVSPVTTTVLGAAGDMLVLIRELSEV